MNIKVSFFVIHHVLRIFYAQPSQNTRCYPPSIRGCQNQDPDTSVKEWCGQHNLTIANYYYRLKEVRKACLQNIPEQAVAQSIVPVSKNLITSSTNAAIEISEGEF